MKQLGLREGKKTKITNWAELLQAQTQVGLTAEAQLNLGLGFNGFRQIQ